MKITNQIKWFLVLVILEGLLPVYLYFRTPSMDKNAVLGGYSLTRLIPGLVLVVFVVLLNLLTLVYFRNQKWQAWSEKLIAEWMAQKNRLLSLLCILIMGILSILATFWLFAADITIDLNMLEVIYARLFGVIIWLFLLCMQAVVFLSINHHRQIKSKGFWNAKVVLKVFLLFSMAGISLFHWAILAFQIQFLVSIPYWTWFFQLKEVNLLVFAVLVLAAIAVIYLVIKKPGKEIRNLILVILLGYLIQVGFGFVSGYGYEALKNKAIYAGHVKYIEYAVDNLRLSDAILNYEESFGWDDYLGTKPPGVIVFYIIDQKISNSIYPVNGYWARFHRLTDFNAVVFPLLTFLSLIPLYYLGKNLVGQSAAWLVCITYIFMPNVILMPMELDVVVFPTVFLFGLLLIQQLTKKRNLYWAIALGVYCYFAMYFTFSMLPLLPLAAAWLGLDYLINYKERKFFDLVKLGAGIAIGFAVMYLIFLFAVNYDPYLRYQNAMIKHKTIKEFDYGIQQILAAIKLNNLELASWVSFPIALLSVVFVIRSISNMIKGKSEALHLFTVAFFLTYAALNVTGQTRGEVGRLWIFMDPAIAVFAVSELLQHFKNQKAGVYFLFGLQILTILFTYRFQDFW